ncbi:MAG: hypothetical protein ACLFOY_19075 [Desulfatibacillaceae bacterium]
MPKIVRPSTLSPQTYQSPFPATVRDILRQNAGQSADAIVRACVAAVERHRDGAGAEDDVTLVVVKVV